MPTSATERPLILIGYSSLIGQDATPTGKTDAYRYGPCGEPDGGVGLFLLRPRQTYHCNQAANNHQADHSPIYTLSSASLVLA
jgi:hypothetical protein